MFKHIKKTEITKNTFTSSEELRRFIILIIKRTYKDVSFDRKKIRFSFRTPTLINNRIGPECEITVEESDNGKYTIIFKKIHPILGLSFVLLYLIFAALSIFTYYSDEMLVSINTLYMFLTLGVVFSPVVLISWLVFRFSYIKQLNFISNRIIEKNKDGI